MSYAPGMAATSVASLAVCPWTVRAVHADDIDLSQAGSLDTPAFRGKLRQGVGARVPGCVHHALIDAKLIESPDVGDAETRLQWIGSAEWEYRCEFDWAEAVASAGVGDQNGEQHIELVIDGLDTVAVVSLNGQVVGNAASFFFPHRFEIGDALRPGQNELVIRFAPPLVHIRAEEARLGSRPFNGDQTADAKWEPFVFIRKPACNLGWDWGPKVATVGVAGGVRIEASASGMRIEHVRPLVTRADAEVAEVRVHVDAVMRAQVPGGEEPHIVATLRAPGGGTVVAQGRGVFVPDDRSRTSVLLGITNPELWWPRGYGPQLADDERPLYELRVELWNGSSLLDAQTTRVGLRTVELDTSPDRWGSAFTLRVNGQPVFCMGANWIPEGLFAGYAGDELIRERIGDAAEMNANMLRVWGGGLYEPACFYDECDKRGVMVWQDFMFSCGMYPEEAPFTKLVELEARHQLARLSTHASVVLWCGGNENIWGHDKWGWRQRLKPGQSWGSGFWVDLLPRLCAEVDPSRPYWPNSPWSGADAGGAQRDVLDADHGDRHTWEVDAWKNSFRTPNASGGGGVPRFCSEFGQQSPSSIDTLREQGVLTDDLMSSCTELSRRQRGPGGDARWYDEPILMMFGPDRAAQIIAEQSSEVGMQRRIAGAQAVQCRLVARGVVWHRVNRPRCGGVLFWQLNDCWAGHSWSAIDAAGRRKPVWEMVRRAMLPRLLSIHIVDAAAMLFMVNDTDAAWEGEIVATRIRIEAPNPVAAVLGEWRSHVRIGARVAGAIVNLDAKLGAPGAVVEAGDLGWGGEGRERVELLTAEAIAADDHARFSAVEFRRSIAAREHPGLATSGISTP